MVRATWPGTRLSGLIRGRLKGATTTVKLFVLLRLGKPLSLTLTLRRLVVAAWVTEGRQVKIPLETFNEALAGACTNWYARDCMGTSGSVARLVTRSVIPTAATRSRTGPSTGGELLA